MVSGKLPRAVKEIRRELERRHWTQGELARQLGTSSGVVSRWLAGDRVPDLAFALRIEELLGVGAKLWLDAA